MNIYIQYGIIFIVLFIIAIAIIRTHSKGYKLDLNKLVEYLGGKDNIIEVKTNISRLQVQLKDTSLVNKEAIQKLGARGIVEIDNQLKIILGSDANKLKKYIEDLKKTDVIK